MIISKTVKVKLSTSNYKHYQELGYEIPTRKTSESTYRINGKRYMVDFGTEIEVAVEDLFPSSSVQVDVQCDYCGQIRNIRYADYTQYISILGKYACRDCGEEKLKEVMFEKYGYTNPFESKEVQDKIKKTNLEKYGAENPFQSKEIQARIKKTNLEKYGVEYVPQAKEVKEKQVATMMKNYGVDNPMKSPEIRAKAKATILERYGYENASQSPDIRQKIIKTMIDRYGVEHNSQSLEIQKKTVQTKYANAKNQINVSIQQIYICNLYHGLLNYPIQAFNVDMLLSDDKIVVEYDGSGHRLAIAYGTFTEKEFNKREVGRSTIIKKEGNKIMRIISHTDKLPSDSKLFEILELSKQYFKEYPNHSWIEWHLDDGFYRNAEHKDDIPYDFGQLRKIKKEEIA